MENDISVTSDDCQDGVLVKWGNWVDGPGGYKTFSCQGQARAFVEGLKRGYQYCIEKAGLHTDREIERIMDDILEKEAPILSNMARRQLNKSFIF